MTREINKGIIRDTVLSEVDFSDKRIKTSLVLDVETTLGKGNEKLLFDIGWVVSRVQKKEIVMQRSFIVQEVFLDMAAMKRAHYFNKYPEYVMGIMTNSIEVKTWAEIKAILEKDIADFNVNRILAYNAGFDKGAITTTDKFFNPKSEFVLDMQCLMVATIESLLATKNYVLTAYTNEWFTDGGNIASGAEYAYRYISKDHEFVEAHTGLEDAIIETQILWAVSDTNGKKIWEIGERDWQDVKAVKERLGLEIEKIVKEKKDKEWLKLSNCKSEVIKLPNRTIEVIVTEIETEVVKVKEILEKGKEEQLTLF